MRVARDPAHGCAATPPCGCGRARAAATPAAQGDRRLGPSRASSPRRWSARPISRPSPGAAPFVKVGDMVDRRPDAADHRSDEDDEPDPGAARGPRHADHRQRRPAGRVRRTADDHRMAASAAMFDKVLIANRGEIALRIHRACHEMGIATVAVHSTADANAMHVRLADESVCIGPPPARDSYLNIPAIIDGVRDHRRAGDPSRLRLPVRERALRRDRRGARHHLHRPEAGTHPADGRQDRGQEGGQGPRHSGRAGLRRRRHRRRRSQAHRRRDRLSGADQGGGRRRRARHEGRAHAKTSCRSRCRPRAPKPRPRSATTRSTSRSISSCRATSKSRSSPTATATSSIWASATARCSAATRRSGRKRPRPRSTPQQRDKIGEVVTDALTEARLSRRRHRRVPVRERRVLLHRDEHAPAGRASGDRDDHRPRSRARADPHRRRRRRSASSRRT